MQVLLKAPDLTNARFQELLTELPHDTCAIPEAPDIPAIPEPEEASDPFDTPPTSMSGALSALGELHKTSTSSLNDDQTRVHTGGSRRCGDVSS